MSGGLDSEIIVATEVTAGNVADGDVATEGGGLACEVASVSATTSLCSLRPPT